LEFRKTGLCTTTQLLVDDNSAFRAVRRSTARFGFKLGWDTAIADLMGVAKFIALEEIGRCDRTHLVALAALGKNSYPHGSHPTQNG
jgi:hypothetical protein